jgi:outer membrane protein TolC
MKILKLIVLMGLILFPQWSQAQKTFSSLDELITYAFSQSTTLQANEIKMTQAKKAKLAAALGVIDPSGNISFSYTNNTQLPVNLFPAEVFGGEPGTFREVQSGVQYVSNFNQNAEIKLFNLAGWENLKLAKLNINLTESDNKLSIKTLQENIASAYFNIVNLQEQLKSSQQNVLVSDTLWQIVKNKYQAGIGKPQDVNDAEANYLNTKESTKQIEYLLQQQYLSLKIFCDIPENELIIINQSMDAKLAQTTVEQNDLGFRNSLLKESVALSSYRQQKWLLLPTISFVASNTRQQFNTRGRLFDNDVRWIPSNYIGIKLNLPMPSANSISQRNKAKFDYLLAQKNTEHTKLKSALEYRQLQVDFDKVNSQYNTNQSIYNLKKDTYQKNLNLYTEGLLDLNQTLNSFNAMVNSNYNLISSNINVLLSQAKIEINNKLK